MPAYPGCPGKEADKRVSATINVTYMAVEHVYESFEATQLPVFCRLGNKNWPKY